MLGEKKSLSLRFDLKKETQYSIQTVDFKGGYGYSEAKILF